MALFQGPYFYYHTSGFIKMLMLVPFGSIGLYLTVYLLVKLIKYKSTNTKYHIIGLTFAFIFGILTIRGDVIEYLDFKFRKNERNQIVDQVKKGILTPNGLNHNGMCILPGNPIFPVSSENMISINKNVNGIVSIEFYIDGGFLDHYSAFLYTNDPTETYDLDNGIANAFNRTDKKLDNNWYRVGY